MLLYFFLLFIVAVFFLIEKEKCVCGKQLYLTFILRPLALKFEYVSSTQNLVQLNIHYYHYYMVFLLKKFLYFFFLFNSPSLVLSLSRTFL